jgi:excisionase family DNA binding protein
MHKDDLFTAPQVAKICSTDLKTIHNWVNKSKIKSFRTPGRHLRFRREDILDFLSRFGYPIPEGFAAPPNQIVLVDADETSRKALKRALSRDFEVEVFSNHVDAALYIGKKCPSLVLVNGDTDSDMMDAAEHLAASRENAAPVAVFGASLSRRQSASDRSKVELVPTSESKEIHRRVMSILGR